MLLQAVTLPEDDDEAKGFLGPEQAPQLQVLPFPCTVPLALAAVIFQGQIESRRALVMDIRPGIGVKNDCYSQSAMCIFLRIPC